MELLAFVHIAVQYEDPTPDPKITLFDGVTWSLPSSAWLSIAGVAVALSLVGTTPETAVAETHQVLGYGSAGQEVAAIQTSLGIEADGLYGSQTESAVKDFQIRQSLQQIDGVVGRETATALGMDEKYRPVAVGEVGTNSGIGVNIRSGPGLDYRRIGGETDGTLLETYGERIVRDGYAWERVSGGGWVATDYVDYGSQTPVSYPVDGGSDAYYVDTRSNIGLNARSGPGLNYSVVGGYTDGTAVSVDEDSVVYRDGYRWKQVSSGNWVASNYLYE